MDYSHFLKKYKLCEKKLLAFGFSQCNECYTYKQDLVSENCMYVEFKISQNLFLVKVFDKTNNEEYLPFNIKTYIGSTVGEIRVEIENIIKKILEDCFFSENQKDKILQYVKKKYDTTPEYPWEKYPEFCTLKTNKKKWYGLILKIPFKSLGKDVEEEIDAINLKLDPDKILSLIDNVNYYPAYHMNKKYWITILLNSGISFSKISELIDESYNNVFK